MPKKGRLGEFADLRRGLSKKEGGGVFEGGLIPQCTLCRDGKLKDSIHPFGCKCHRNLDWIFIKTDWILIFQNLKTSVNHLICSHYLLTITDFHSFFPGKT